jgi:redox-sensitive bicupin YhaK (pirin superfamily)
VVFLDRFGPLTFTGGMPMDVAPHPHIGLQTVTETIIMWWNFVARTPDEIAQARDDWEAHRRFGEVKAYAGPRLDAPSLQRLARPNPVS